MASTNGFGIRQRLPAKRTLSPEFFYIKTIKGRALTRMHSAAVLAKAERLKKNMAAMDPHWVYTKTVKGIPHPRMHRAKVTGEIRTQQKKLESIQDKTASLEAEMQKIIEACKPLDKKGSDRLKTSLAGLLKEISIALEGELQFIGRNGNTTKTRSSGTMDRMHCLRNLMTICQANAGLMEYSGIVDERFFTEALAKAKQMERAEKKTNSP